MIHYFSHSLSLSHILNQLQILLLSLHILHLFADIGRFCLLVEGKCDFTKYDSALFIIAKFNGCKKVVIYSNDISLIKQRKNIDFLLLLHCIAHFSEHFGFLSLVFLYCLQFAAIVDY